MRTLRPVKKVFSLQILSGQRAKRSGIGLVLGDPLAELDRDRGSAFVLSPEPVQLLTFSLQLLVFGQTDDHLDRAVRAGDHAMRIAGGERTRGRHGLNSSGLWLGAGPHIGCTSAYPTQTAPAPRSGGRMLRYRTSGSR